MDVAMVIRQRLDELDLDQRDLARAADVTESYVSQILTHKKAPPAPDRTDIYDRMDRFLRLPQGELARVAEAHLKDELKRRLGEIAPLFPELRELILGKCVPNRLEQVRAILERQSFGELERLVAQKLLDAARLGGDVLHVSGRQLARLDDLIESWEWDPSTFAVKITLAPRQRGRRQAVKRFEYLERVETDAAQEKGLREFLRDPGLSGGATDEELAFLKALRFRDRRPTSLYYYRELQNLRDPIHFRAT
ncbi:MAG TPA: helix-turn-helix transcriptional regulator [Gemmatimonadales bacterium]|jgi:transcriptional regulator with XRE-family HTH domain|nr:helix-turn-helix transcriptional regulator [Gemmatimonadales bacterium]